MKIAQRWLAAAAATIGLGAIWALHTTVRAETAGKVGQTMPAFKVTDLSGKQITLANYRGKVLLLDFWATWCPPCRGEVPNIVAAYKKHHASGFEVLGISLDRSRQALAEYTRQNKMNWPQVFGKDSSTLAAQLNIEYIPSSYLVDGKTGKILAKNLRGNELENAVKQALSQRK